MSKKTNKYFVEDFTLCSFGITDGIEIPYCLLKDVDNGDMYHTYFKDSITNLELWMADKGYINTFTHVQSDHNGEPVEYDWEIRSFDEFCSSSMSDELDDMLAKYIEYKLG